MVILIIGILMAVAMPAFLNQQTRAKDAEVKQYLNSAWKAARSDSIDNGGAYKSPAHIVKAIRSAEPDLQPRVAGRSELKSLQAKPTVIAVDPESTANKLEMYAHSASGTIFELSAAASGRPQTIALGKGPQKPAKPFPWKTIGIVVGFIFGAIIALAMFLFSAMHVHRRRVSAREALRRHREWERLIEEPGYCGPFEAEDGYEILVPEKREEIAGPAEVNIHFIVSRYGWNDEDGAWNRLEVENDVDLSAKHKKFEAAQRRRKSKLGFLWMSSKGDRHQIAPTKAEIETIEHDLQTVWPADTEIDVLAEAWSDFKERVKTYNRLSWYKEVESREDAVASRRELERQLKVADLLDGVTVRDDMATQLEENVKKLRETGKDEVNI